MLSSNKENSQNSYSNPEGSSYLVQLAGMFLLFLQAKSFVITSRKQLPSKKAHIAHSKSLREGHLPVQVKKRRGKVTRHLPDSTTSTQRTLFNIQQ